MYDLFIGNKNYSSWSLRPWVLLRELNIPFRESLVPFGGAAESRRVPRLLAHRQGALPGRRQHHGVGLAAPSPSTWASGMPASGPPKLARAPGRARASAEMHSGFFGAAQYLHDELRHLRITLTPSRRAAASAISRGSKSSGPTASSRFGGPFLTGARFCAVDAFFAPVAFRIQTYDPPLDAGARRYAAQLLRAAVDEGLVRGGAAGNLARRGARSRSARRGRVARQTCARGSQRMFLRALFAFLALPGVVALSRSRCVLG